jgi:hypothetical protein
VWYIHESAADTGIFLTFHRKVSLSRNFVGLEKTVVIRQHIITFISSGLQIGAGGSGEVSFGLLHTEEENHHAD